MKLLVNVLNKIFFPAIFSREFLICIILHFNITYKINIFFGILLFFVVVLNVKNFNNFFK